jgi:hypothetical protein
MFGTNYLESVGALAGVLVTRRKPSKGELREQALIADRVIGIAKAKASFPNALGNYRGKRNPKPLVPALTPAERFRKLNQQHADFRARRGAR